MAGEWTPERRAAAAARIHTWAPWTRSTGPVTAEGKAVSSQNRYEGGVQPAQRAMRREGRALMKALDDIEYDVEAFMARELAAAIEGMRLEDQRNPRVAVEHQQLPAPAPTGEF